jgi:uncharacterized protein YjbI with pentapeptide repeats
VITVAGSPRSLAEMDFVAGMRPCEVCGDWRPVAWRTGGTGAEWITRAACPRCANERAYLFHSAEDLVDVEVADLELGGAEPSTVLEPFDLVREIDRLVPALALSPERLAGEEWEANVVAVDRVRTALTELQKFLPPDSEGDAIPVEALRAPASHLDRAMRPERYSAAWMREERAYWDGIAAAIARDAPRIFEAGREIKPPRGTLDGDALAAHRVWLESGGARGTRLVVVTADAAARVVRGADLTGCRLEQLRFAGADLVGATLARAELVDVDLQRARIETATLTGARLVHCTVAGAIAEHTSFAELRAERCDFTRAQLATSSWQRARIEDCTFTAADLADTHLGLAHFIACDLRGASLAGAILAGAVFERCDLREVNLSGADLRGAAFMECAFAGAQGEPFAVAGWIVTAADFSDRGDATDLGDADDLLSELS